jgi:hypothetical protein
VPYPRLELARNLVAHEVRVARVQEARAEFCFLFRDVTGCLRLLQEGLFKMDVLVESADAIGVERGGWRLPTPMAAARSWRSLMSILAGKCLTLLLEQFVETLDKATTKLKNTIPSWEAAFPQNAPMNIPLAVKLTKGKAPGLVASHNVVHGVLASISSSSANLQVAPRVMDHPVCSDAIKVALAGMEKTKQAMTLIQGISILEAAETEAESSTHAKEFVKDNFEDHKELPGAFWVELRHLCEGIAVGSPPPKTSKQAQSEASSGKATPVAGAVGGPPSSKGSSPSTCDKQPQQRVLKRVSRSESSQRAPSPFSVPSKRARG